MGKKQISDKDLLTRLRKFTSKLGRPPTQKEMTDSGPHAAATYADRFGSWNDALNAAGLEVGVHKPTGRLPTPTEDLIESLKSVAEMVEGAPAERDYRKHGNYAVKTYCRRFGGWNLALQAAGFEPNVEMDLSEEMLITTLQEFAAELGRPPTSDEMDQRGPYSAAPYKRVFGNWNQALRRAGLEIHQAQDVTEDELLSEFRRLAEERERVPRRDEMRDQGKWNGAIYQERFGSWNEVLLAAGFEPNDRCEFHGRSRWPNCERLRMNWAIRQQQSR